jgi:RimJ/RimL family protein N-acetyltransferase
MKFQAGFDESVWRNESVELFLLDEADVNASYVAWLNDPLVNRYLESRFSHHDESSTRQFVRGCMESATTLLLGIRSQALGRHVGNIKLELIDSRHGLGEIGVLIGDKETWNTGLASAAIRDWHAMLWSSQDYRRLL